MFLELFEVVLLVPERHLVVVEDGVHERDEDGLGRLRLLLFELVRSDACTERRLRCRIRIRRIILFCQLTTHI